MKKWKLDYELHSTFGSSVINHAFSLRCFPKEMVSQDVKNLNIAITPCSDVSRGRDSFQNLLLTGFIGAAHDNFDVHVSADVAVNSVFEPESKDFYKLGMYRSMTPLTRLGENLERFYQRIKSDDSQTHPCEMKASDKLNFLNQVTLKEIGEDDWVRAARIMDMVYRSFRYVSGSTDFYTTAEEAWTQGCGVCQDYTHIFISLCRKEGMTVRYVAGAIPGEGQTHAWAQVWQNGFWKGFDPTNNKITDEDYICFAFGRDAGDCFLNRGIFRGDAVQLQSVCVRMREDKAENTV